MQFLLFDNIKLFFFFFFYMESKGEVPASDLHSGSLIMCPLKVDIIVNF